MAVTATREVKSPMLLIQGLASALSCYELLKMQAGGGLLFRVYGGGGGGPVGMGEMTFWFSNF